MASAPMPGYADVRIAATSATTLRRRIDEFQPDVIHLASPMVLGGRAVVAAHDAMRAAVAQHDAMHDATAAPTSDELTTAIADALTAAGIPETV